MAFWLDRVHKLDVPVPETQPIPIDHSREGLPGYDTELACEIVENLGGEAFARTDFKSASLDLRAGSHIHTSTEESVKHTLAELFAQQAMMQMPIGKQIYLREWLDLDWITYGRENFHPEVRVFVRENDIAYYYPRHDWSTSDQPGAGYYKDALQIIDRDWDEIKGYAQQVAEEFKDDGWFSVDFVCTTDHEWYLTDMALDALYERDGKWRNISSHAPDQVHNLENMLENSTE